MPSYTQEDRLFQIDTPLGKDVLLLKGFNGTEGISRLFRFELDLLSEDSSISFSDIIGKNVTISLKQADGSYRYINGFISRFAQTAMEETVTSYEAEMVPWLWFLTRNANCRIFQNKTVPDIITQVFDDLGFNDYSDSLHGSYEPREYCVQYRESDFSFVSRLMEEYGIFYFFKHEQASHTLVLADDPSTYPDCPGQSSFRYVGVAGQPFDEDVITSWRVEQELRTGKCTLTDYNFTTPSTSLLVNEPTICNIGGNDKYDTYDYPGEHLNKGAGQFLAKIRMQEQEAGHLVACGTSDARAFVTGHKFTLEEHYRSDANDDYVLTETHHAGKTDAYGTSGAPEKDNYSNSFACILASVPFRPVRITPRPIVKGPQPAVVVGPKGEEIYTDKYGRVKVQFFWDREGKRDQSSSCWIRVSQPWAGKNWGALWIPRIGQEVIVDFLEGDPDGPLITGRVYNAEQMPPYELPGNHTRSTFQSRSSKGGGLGNYNEIRFEDKKGSEQIFINAEKDMDLRVEQASREFVGNERHLIVNANQLEVVGADKHGHVKGNHFEKIEGDMSLQIGRKQMEKVGGDKSVEVDGAHREKIVGAMSVQVGQDLKEQVGGNASLQVGQSRNEKVGMTDALEAGQTIHLKGGMTVIIEAGMQLSLKGPGGFVDIGPAGVTIQGTMVLINSGGAPGSGPGASPDSPDAPDAPTDPKDPDVADDGSKGGKLS